MGRGRRARGWRGCAAGLLAALLACGGESGEAPAGPADPPPARNVLLITVDTLRADALGAYRPELATSPAIDRLAAEGLLFEQVASASPITLPSHASIFTGTWPFAHGVRSNSGYALPAAQYTLAERFRDAGYATHAEVASGVMARRKGLAQGFLGYRDPDAGDARRRPGGERDAADVTRFGIDFLRRHRDRPFFLWLHYYDPHADYSAPPEFARRFPDSGYHAEVAYADDAVGRVVDALRELDLAERTLVAVTSDHGEGLGEHGEATHSLLVYDTTMRIPLVLWGPPDLPRGRRVAALARSIDIAPTLLDWAGLAPLPDAQGRPLQELLVPDAAPRHAYGESFEAQSAFGASALRFLREGRWKYIHKAGPELYELGSDPNERHNRIADSPERVAALREALGALLDAAPPAPREAARPIEPEEAARLAALGYVAAAPTPLRDESLALQGSDPNRTLEDWTRLGRAYHAFASGDHARAAELYAELGERHPEGLPVLRGWIDSLRMLGRPAEMRPLLERALALAPDDAELRLKLVESLEAAGELEAAESQVRAAHAANPCGDLEIAYLSRVLRARGRYREQRDALRLSARECAGDGALNEYAYFLATVPDAALRDGEEALRLARRLVPDPASARPEYLDTLACALAERGDSAQAVRLQRQALAKLEGADLPDEALAVFHDHLARFEAGLPARDPAPPATQTTEGRAQRGEADRRPN